MKKLKLFKYKNTIIISDGYRKNKLHGLCLYRNRKYRKYLIVGVGYYSIYWDRKLFKEIESVTINNLSKSKVNFYRTDVGFIVGKYIIGRYYIDRTIPNYPYNKSIIDTLTIKKINE